MRSALTVLAIVAFLALPACSQDKSAQEAANHNVIAIKTGTVRHAQQREFVPVSGTVATPDAPVQVAFLVPGKVVQVTPREGDYVKKGQLLAAIDPLDYRLALQAASAQAGQAKVALERSQDEYNRMKFLYESRSLAENDFEKFKAVFLGAKQQLDLALANQGLAQKRLDDAKLHAPADGFISRRGIEPGQTASPGHPVFEIVQLDPMEITVGVPETDIHLVKIGQTANIAIPALPGKSFEGTVRVVNVSADPQTRTYMTRIAVPNPGHFLRVGMVAQAQIQGDKMVDLMTLPAETILKDPQGVTIVFVYYPEKGRVYARRVETGAVHGREIVIKSGLAGNEAVVFAGQGKLRDGAAVSLADNTAPEKAQGSAAAKEVR